MAHNEAHNALVYDALQELAKAGYTAWKNESGAWFDKYDRPHKYGKKGSGDIIIILPVMVQFCSGIKRLVGWHVEAEAKTGAGRQSTSQNLHQEYCVERNGGVYILFRDVNFLLEELKRMKNT